MERRYSQQRARIYETVAASCAHPTAQMVYDALRREMPQLSLGTVYRNLRQLAQEGQLRELDGPTARYDSVVQPHSHIRCVRCGALADAGTPYDPALDRSGPARGWMVQGHDLTFYGVCPACAENDRSNESKGEKVYGTEGKQDRGQSVDRIRRGISGPEQV